MKLKELFLEKLSETYIFEMAMQRKLAKEKVSNMSYEVIRHLIKIVVMPDAYAQKHWIVEVNNWLEKMQKIVLKPDNTPVDKNSYYEWLVNLHDYNIPKLLIGIKKEYSDEKIVVPEDLDITIKNLLVRICWLLPTDEYIDVEELLKPIG